jgi:YVTN family beta-propeller protein
VISRRTFLAATALSVAACRRGGETFRGYAFIANQDGGTVAAVDLEVMAVAKHIPVNGSPAQVVAAQSRGAVYALTTDTGAVHEIETGTLRLARSVTAAPRADLMRLAVDEAFLFVVAREARLLAAVSLEDMRVTWRMRLPEEPVDLALSPDGQTAAVTSPTTIRLVSLKERSAGEPLARGNFGQALFLSNGERLVAAGLDARQISIFRVHNPRLMTHLPIAVRPDHLCFSRDGGQLFVTGEGMDAVVIVYPYDIPEVAETILAGHAPAAMTASDALLFITNPSSGDVSVLNIATHRIVAVVPVGSHPGQVAITPDELFALVLNRDSGDVTVLSIDGIQPNRSKSAPLVTVIPVGSRPVSAALHSL